MLVYQGPWNRLKGKRVKIEARAAYDSKSVMVSVDGEGACWVDKENLAEVY